MKYLHGYKTDEDFSQFVHNKWNSGHNIDINQNLSTFPRLNWTDHKVSQLVGYIRAGLSVLKFFLRNRIQAKRLKPTNLGQCENIPVM